MTERLGNTLKIQKLFIILHLVEPQDLHINLSNNNYISMSVAATWRAENPGPDTGRSREKMNVGILRYVKERLTSSPLQSKEVGRNWEKNATQH